MSSPAAQSLGPLLRYLPFQTFNRVQEAVIPALFNNDHNCLIAAPTGSGKTVLLEVAMLRLFRDRLVTSSGENAKAECKSSSLSSSPDWGVHGSRKYKAVYVCPIKALANEKYEHWQAQFPSLSVVIETGDQMQQREVQHKTISEDSSGIASSVFGSGASTAAAAAAEDMSTVSKADILVTTPERWDSITRRWKEKEVMAIVNSVGLLLLDEVHTVQEERGAAMEAIVSRVKAIQTATAHDVINGAATRIVAISGTLPNIRDMAEWLEVSPDMTFAFSAADRPVPLTIKVISYAHDSANPFAFGRFLAFKLFLLVQQFSEGKPTLVFCASRKEVTSTAAQLVEDIRSAATRRDQLAQLQPSEETRQLSQQASDKQLRSCLLSGIGFHHAAMASGDRLLVERMFREQYIVVVCSTTTLALGVNLPAHLVIVKGTTFFTNGQCQDISVSEVMQMCGRAGRPGTDTHGVALVLTTQRKSHLYATLCSGTVTLTCVESHLHRHMIEHVNAEVALRTIHSFHSATEWAKTTFFWIRLRQCPQHYGLAFASKAEEDEFSAHAFMEAFMERVLRVLMEEGCISISRTAATLNDVPNVSFPATGHGNTGLCDGVLDDIRRPGTIFEPTRLGRAMSRMYILFDTVCVLNADLKRRGVAKGVRQQQQEKDDAADAKETSSTTGTDAEKTEDNEKEEAHDAMAVATSAVAEHEEAGTTHVVEEETSVAGDVSVMTDAHDNVATPFTLQETLQLLCQCQELVDVRLRQGDRGPLNAINRAVRFPLHSGRRGGREVREDWHKAYLLIQAHVGLVPITEVSLRNDATRLWSMVPRVSRFLEEYAWSQSSSFSFVCCANVLARCMERRVWPDGLVLRQLPQVSDAVAKSLLRGGYRSFDSLRGADARQLEVLCGRLPPFGSVILSHVRSLPQLQIELQLHVAGNDACVSRSNTLGSKCVGTVRVFLVQVSQCAHSSDDSSGGNAKPITVDSRIALCGDAFKRHGGRSALTESAVRDGRLLLVVGAPAADRILLKRFVPLPPPYSGAPSQFPGEARNTFFDRAMTAADPVTVRREIAFFSFHIPPLLKLAQSDSTAQQDARCRIQAWCFVLHSVGLDVTSQVSDADLSSAAKRRAVPSASSTVAVASAVSLDTPTLEHYWTANNPAPKNVVKYGSKPHQKTVVKTDAVRVEQTVKSKQIAAEASDSFNALLADMTYVMSDDKAVVCKQQHRERKRLRSELDNKGGNHEGQTTAKSMERHHHGVEEIQLGAAEAPVTAAAETTKPDTEAAVAVGGVSLEQVTTRPTDPALPSSGSEKNNETTPARPSRKLRTESPDKQHRSSAGAAAHMETKSTVVGAPLGNDAGAPASEHRIFCSPASTKKAQKSRFPGTVRLPHCVSPPATRPSAHLQNMNSPPMNSPFPGEAALHPQEAATRGTGQRRFVEEAGAIPSAADAVHRGGQEGLCNPQRCFTTNALPSLSPSFHGAPTPYAAPFQNGQYMFQYGSFPECYIDQSSGDVYQRNYMPPFADNVEQLGSSCWATPSPAGVRHTYHPAAYTPSWSNTPAPPAARWRPTSWNPYAGHANWPYEELQPEHSHTSNERPGFAQTRRSTQPLLYTGHRHYHSAMSSQPAYSDWATTTNSQHGLPEHTPPAPATTTLSFLQPGRWHNSLPSLAFKSVDAAFGRHSVPPQTDPFFPPQDGSQLQRYSTTRPFVADTNIATSSGFFVSPNARTLQEQQPHCEMTLALPQARPATAATPFAGNDSYTQQVRRSAMVSQSWWQ